MSSGIKPAINLVKIFANFRNKERYPAGAFIVQEGDDGQVMYVLLEGTVEIRLAGVPIGELGTGEIFGEMALIDARPRSAAVVAKSDCTVVLVNRTQFTVLIQEAPEFALFVMEVMARRLRTLDNSVRALFELGARQGG